MSDAPVRTIRFAPPRARGGGGLQVAPLVDIVFLLICFYLLVTQLTNEQKDPQVQLAAMHNDVATPESPAELVINLRPDGRMSVSGRIVTPPEVRSLLIEQRKAAQAAGTEFRAVVRPDRGQPCGKMLDIIRLCRQVGLKSVIHRSVTEEGP